MAARTSKPSAAAAASIGLVALASAMGIGRFSLTPILPLMQQDAGLSLRKIDGPLTEILKELVP